MSENNVKMMNNKNPILMIHGIISDACFFDEIKEFLKDDLDVIAYDRRGYGEDICDKETDYSVAAQSEDAIRALAYHDLKPAWVFGNSAGGLIAIELALRHPELVKGLILMEPSLVFDRESSDLIAAWNRELNGYVKAGKIKKALPAFIRVIGNENEEKQSTSLSEIKKVYKNLKNFMYGELNDIQSYRPTLEEVKSIKVPVVTYITKDGKDSIFGKTSLSGASALGWKIEWIPGYHNTVKEHPEKIAGCIKKTIHEMEK